MWVNCVQILCGNSQFTDCFCKDFNTFGPGELPGEYRNVIPNFIAKALRNEPLIITGTGDETRDFTFVDNTVDLLIKSAFSHFKKGEVFNAGTGKSQKIIDIANQIISLTGSNSQITFVEQRGWDHIAERCSEISKSERELGYVPIVDIEKQPQITCDWIRKHL